MLGETCTTTENILGKVELHTMDDVVTTYLRIRLNIQTPQSVKSVHEMHTIQVTQCHNDASNHDVTTSWARFHSNRIDQHLLCSLKQVPKAKRRLGEDV